MILSGSANQKPCTRGCRHEHTQHSFPCLFFFHKLSTDYTIELKLGTYNAPDNMLLNTFVLQQSYTGKEYFSLGHIKKLKDYFLKLKMDT